MNIGHQRTLAFKKQIDALIEEGILEIIWISEELVSEAWGIFTQFNVDKKWSFTDCTSYVIMKQVEIDEAFAFDHHFEQMGFVRRP